MEYNNNMLQYVSQKEKEGKKYTLYFDVERLKHVLDIDGTKRDSSPHEWIEMWTNPPENDKKTDS
jgi:hypothetical protein